MVKLNDLKDLFVIENYPLKDITWYKTGGNAEFAVFPKNNKELIRVFTIANKKQIPLFVLGGCANVIISDKGLPGITLITSKLNKIFFKSGKIYAQCGVSLKELAEFAASKGVTGFEFLYDIPGSVGGSLIMNAGNNYGETSMVVRSVDALNPCCKLISVKLQFCKFGYRTSVFKEKDMFVLGAWFNGAKKGEKKEIFKLMNKIKKERTLKFPLEYPNGGSVFKRPKGDYAGRLIEVSGCGGMNVGGAFVSEKHKGFIVNKNNATSTDIKRLIKKVQLTVKDKTGIMLEREQIFLPEDKL